MSNIIEFSIHDGITVKITEYDPTSGGSTAYNSEDPPYGPEIENAEIWVQFEDKILEMPDSISEAYYEQNESAIYTKFLEEL